jgi:hypothetical protein
MTDKRSRNSWIPIVLGIVFGSILIVMVLNGGMCERYERRMQRQRMMQEYLDSMRKK